MFDKIKQFFGFTVKLESKVIGGWPEITSRQGQLRVLVLTEAELQTLKLALREQLNELQASKKYAKDDAKLFKQMATNHPDRADDCNNTAKFFFKHHRNLKARSNKLGLIQRKIKQAA